MRIVARLLLLALVLRLAAVAAVKAPFTFDAMMKILRIGDPQLSPDGKLVAFTVQSVDLPNNAKPTQIYVVPVDGGAPQRLTNDGTLNTRPRWTPDSKHILFISNRSNGSQVWSMDPAGAGPKPITNLPTEADGETVSPDGKLIDLYQRCFSGL